MLFDRVPRPGLFIDPVLHKNLKARRGELLLLNLSTILLAPLLSTPYIFFMILRVVVAQAPIRSLKISAEVQYHRCHCEVSDYVKGRRRRMSLAG